MIFRFRLIRGQYVVEVDALLSEPVLYFGAGLGPALRSALGLALRSALGLALRSALGERLCSFLGSPFADFLEPIVGVRAIASYWRRTLSR